MILAGIIIIAFLLLPYLLSIWLYGWNLLKRIFEEGNWKKGQGLEKAVKTWSNLTPQERMEVTLTNEKIAGGSVWIPSPTPKEEEQARNEKVFQEGIVHPLPETQVEEAKETN